jgi:hypothetical protein
MDHTGSGFPSSVGYCMVNQSLVGKKLVSRLEAELLLSKQTSYSASGYGLGKGTIAQTYCSI